MLLAALVASVLSGMMTFSAPLALLLFLVVPVVGSVSLRRERVTFFVFALGIQIAGWGLVQFRAEFGFTWLVWMVLIVWSPTSWATSPARRSAGRSSGPRSAPRRPGRAPPPAGSARRWSALCSTGFSRYGAGNHPDVDALAFAGQMGDIAESALKRRMGVKDSSTLIPGHGGLFDRFDALLGGALFLLAVTLFFDLPGVRF